MNNSDIEKAIADRSMIWMVGVEGTTIPTAARTAKEAIERYAKAMQAQRIGTIKSYLSEQGLPESQAAVTLRRGWTATVYAQLIKTL